MEPDRADLEPDLGPAPESIEQGAEPDDAYRPSAPEAEAGTEVEAETDHHLEALGGTAEGEVGLVWWSPEEFAAEFGSPEAAADLEAEAETELELCSPPTALRLSPRRWKPTRPPVRPSVISATTTTASNPAPSSTTRPRPSTWPRPRPDWS